MKFKPDNQRQEYPAQRALTLLELMVAMSLLSVIILGLYQMFDRTQSAFRNSLKQVDVLEAARAVMQMMTLDLEQAQASHQTNGTNFYIAVDLSPGLVQPMPGNQPGTSVQYTTNQLQEFYFLTRQTSWRAVAYLVVAPSPNTADMILYSNGVGSLARFEFVITNINTFDASQPITNYLSPNAATNFQRVADGVVHLQLNAYDTNGFLLTTNNVNVFTNGQLPAYVELEFGVLETEVLKQARGLLNMTASANFLSSTNRGSRTHIFRERIPIRTATQ